MLLAQTALLQSAKRQLIVDDLARVDPGVAGVDSLGRTGRAVEIVRPDRRTQSVDRAVSLFYVLIEILDPQNRKRRSENFFADQGRVLGNVGDKRRQIVMAAIVFIASRPLASGQYLSAAADGVLNL